ncbi:MAG: AmmeMemoRadiSam system protein B [archaeon]
MILPQISGQLYEKDFGKLTKQIEDSFNNKHGPGELPCSRNKKRLVGIIAPCSGYVFSGPAMAWVYKQVAEHKFPSTYIILTSDNENKYNKPTSCLQNWQTMFGQVQVDKSFILELKDKYNIIDVVENLNSPGIEIQLPFLQYVNKDHLNYIKIVPLVIPNHTDHQKLAEKILSVNEDICVIVSTDFTRYGPFHNYVPFKFNVLKTVEEMDAGIIEKIKSLNSEQFLEHCEKLKVNLQGQSTIATLLEISKNYFTKVNVMNYYNSGDMLEDHTNFVTFASISFEE